MQINTKFDFKQKVKIPELGRCGIVIEIFINEWGSQYRVRYFDNGEGKTVTFFEEELAKE